MDEESAFGGLLNISLSDDTTETGDAAASAQRAGGDSPPATASSKTDRRVQSEADHQALREKYKAKVANGEVVLHAVEELYYLRRYREAVDFIHEALGPEGRSDVLDGDVRGTLVHYEGLCVRKLESR